MLRQNHMFRLSDKILRYNNMHDFSEVSISDVYMYSVVQDEEQFEANYLKQKDVKHDFRTLVRTYDFVKTYRIKDKIYQASAIITVTAKIDRDIVFRGKYHIDMLDSLVRKMSKDGGWMNSALKQAIMKDQKINEY